MAAVSAFIVDEVKFWVFWRCWNLRYHLSIKLGKDRNLPLNEGKSELFSKNAESS